MYLYQSVSQSASANSSVGSGMGGKPWAELGKRIGEIFIPYFSLCFYMAISQCLSYKAISNVIYIVISNVIYTVIFLYLFKKIYTHFARKKKPNTLCERNVEKIVIKNEKKRFFCFRE